jgi:phage terminase large subunit-like protein
VDPGDDWTHPDTLRKANPNYGVSVFADFLLSQLANAKLAPRKAAQFQTKHLNVWVQAREPYFDTLAWKDAKNPHLGLEQFQGWKAYVTLDLASKIDLASMTVLVVYPPEIAAKRKKKFALFTRYYLPEDTVEMPENERYRGWEAEGHLFVTDGSMIDFERIREDLVDLAGFLDVQAVGIDPWQATQMIAELQNENVPVIEYRQTVQNFSDHMKYLDAVIRGRLVDHDGDPITLWCLGNVVAREDAKENVYPRKERKENKIDGAVSAIMAVGLLNNADGPQESVYERRGLAEVIAT